MVLPVMKWPEKQTKTNKQTNKQTDKQQQNKTKARTTTPYFTISMIVFFSVS